MNDPKAQEKSSKSHIKTGEWTYKRYQKALTEWGCVLCGSMEKLHIHHKDKNRLNNNLKNLVCLCAKCHVNVHRELKKENH